jgi:hypothetical protein
MMHFQGASLYLTPNVDEATRQTPASTKRVCAARAAHATATGGGRLPRPSGGAVAGTPRSRGVICVPNVHEGFHRGNC